MISIKLGTETSTLGDSNYADSLETSSRIVPFPDGLARHITLRKLHWAVIDRHTRNGWPPHALPEIAFLAQQQAFEEMGPFDGRPDFEELLRASIEGVIASMEMRQASNRAQD